MPRFPTPHRRTFAAATAVPALLFAAILGIGGVAAWRDPYARPPTLPVRRPPVWGLPAAGAALGAATIAGATVVARGPGAEGVDAPGGAGGTTRARAVRSAAALGLSAAAVPGVMAVAFEASRRTLARRNRGVAGTVVILGCALRGTEPSSLLRLRLEKGAEVARRAAPAAAVAAGPAAPDDSRATPATVVACGGTGADDIIAEAVVMARWLRARGIPDVIEEAESTSTIENLDNAAPLVADAPVAADAPVVVVTSDFHVFRTRWLTRRRGLTGWRVEGAPTPARYWATSMLREFLALGVLWPLPGLALGAALAAWGLAATN